MPQIPDQHSDAPFQDAGVEEHQEGTLPGLGPPPPAPAPMPPADDDHREDIDEIEEIEEIEEIDAGELAGPSSPRLPVGGEGLSGPLVLPDVAPADGQAGPSVLEQALAEAAAGDWARAAEEMRAELDTETDRARAAVLAYELGELSETRLRDEGGAVKSYGRALQSDPSLRPNLWAIRRVFYRRALWPNLLKLIDAEVRFARSDPERADLLVEKAHVLEDRLGDSAGARDAYERAIALHPTHIGALLGRERQALIDRDNETLLRVWRQLADSSTAPARKVGYLVDRARLLAALALAGPPDASDATLKEALDVIAEAGSLASAPGVDPELVARERERIAELSRDPEDLLAACDVRIALLSRDPARAREIVALRRRQARVARERGDRAGALRYLEEAASLAPDEPLLCYDLADLGEEVGAPDVAATALQRLAALAPGPDLALALRRADALARAGREDEAEAARAEATALAPASLPLLVIGERAAQEAGDRRRVAELRIQEAAAAQGGSAFGPGAAFPPDPGWAAAAAVSAGDIYGFDLGRDDDARAAYQSALASMPGYPPAVEGLVALHLSAGRAPEAVALLEQSLATAPAVRAEEMLDRLAALYEQIDQPGDAQRALERLLERRPDDPLTTHRLERLYAADGRHAERAALLGAIAERTLEPARKAALLFEIGRVQEDALQDLGAAVDAYRAALELDPDDRTVRGALHSALRRAGRWEELAAELTVEAEIATGPGSHRALREAAAILGRRLGRTGESAAVYRDLCDRAPEDVAALRGLASALADTPDEAVLALEREVAVLGDGSAAAQALVRLAELYDALGSEEDAAAAYRRARDAGDGTRMHALWALVDGGARRGDRALLAEALHGLAEHTSDEEVRGDLLEELAWLAVDDVDDAAARFDDLVRAAPDRRGAQLGKALLAARRRDAAELAGALIAQAERTSDTGVAAALLLRAAALREVMARTTGGAAASERDAAALAARAFSLAPDAGGALLAVVERPAPPDADVGERAALMARRAEMAQDADARAELHLERAEELESAGRLLDAGRAMCDVLRAVPGHLGALYGLRRLAKRAGDTETLARASYQLGRALTEPTAAAAHLSEAAALLDGDLGRSDQGGRIWQRVFELTPEHPVAFQRAHEVLSAADDAAGLVALLGRKIQSLGPSADVIPHLLERAALRRRLGALDEASEDLAAVLDLDPGHVAALSVLAEVRLEQGEARAAADLLAQYNETVSDPEQRAEGELRLARLLEDLGDRAGAIDALDMVLTARSDDIPAREKLVELLIAEDDYARAAQELSKLAGRRGERADRARDELRAARMFRDQVDDPTRARAAYERCLAADPLHVDALRELCAIAEGAARGAALERTAGEVRRLAGSADPAPLKMLAVVAELAGDESLAFSATGALEARGVASEDERRRYLALRVRLTAPLHPRRALADDEWRTRVQHPLARGPLSDAWACLAESAGRLADVDPAQLGFTRGDRIASKALARQAPAVEAALRVIGAGDIELYVSSARSTFARAAGGDTPLVLLSADVARAETLEARTLLGRTLGAARLRVGAIDDMAPEDVGLLFAAGVKAAGGDPGRVPGLAAQAASSRLDEQARAVARVIARKDRKALLAVVDRIGDADVADWLTAMRATVRRAGLLLGGDVPVALAGLPARGATTPLVGDLIAYAVSESYLYLRKDLGLG